MQRPIFFRSFLFVLLTLVQTPFAQSKIQFHRNANGKLDQWIFPDGERIEYGYTNNVVTEKRMSGFKDLTINGTFHSEDYNYFKGVLDEFFGAKFSILPPLLEYISTFFTPEKRDEFLQAADGKYGNLADVINGQKTEADKRTKFKEFIDQFATNVLAPAAQTSIKYKDENMKLSTQNISEEEKQFLFQVSRSISACNSTLAAVTGNMSENKLLRSINAGHEATFTSQFLLGSPFYSYPFFAAEIDPADPNSMTRVQRFIVMRPPSGSIPNVEMFLTQLNIPELIPVIKKDNATPLTFALARELGNYFVYRYTDMGRNLTVTMNMVDIFLHAISSEEWSPAQKYVAEGYKPEVKAISKNASTYFALDALTGCL